MVETNAPIIFNAVPVGSDKIQILKVTEFISKNIAIHAFHL